MNISTLGSSALSAADLSAMRKQQFQKADSDSDGALNKDELATAMSNKPKPPDAPEMDTDKFFKSIDTDGDERITEAEMDAGMEKMAANRPTGSRPSAPAGPPPAGGPPPGGGGGAGAVSSDEESDTEVYDARDTNKDGTVSMEEQLTYDLSQLAQEKATKATKAGSAAGDKTQSVGVYLDTKA